MIETVDDDLAELPRRGLSATETAVAAAACSRVARLRDEGVPLIVIPRQLGHTNLGITSIYLQGIDSTGIIDAVRSRRPPMILATAGLRTAV